MPFWRGSPRGTRAPLTPCCSCPWLAACCCCCRAAHGDILGQVCEEVIHITQLCDVIPLFLHLPARQHKTHPDVLKVVHCLLASKLRPCCSRLRLVILIAQVAHSCNCNFKLVFASCNKGGFAADTATLPSLCYMHHSLEPLALLPLLILLQLAAICRCDKLLRVVIHVVFLLTLLQLTSPTAAAGGGRAGSTE